MSYRLAQLEGKVTKLAQRLEEIFNTRLEVVEDRAEAAPSDTSPRPCPFCGGGTVIVSHHAHDHRSPLLLCSGCNAYGPPAESVQDAVRLWNGLGAP